MVLGGRRSTNHLQLRCSCETTPWIAAEFEWKLHSVEHFDGAVDVSRIDKTRKNPTPHVISQFDIEITLGKGYMPSLRSRLIQSTYQINESLLVDDAFRPKIYTVRLEKGNFLSAHDAMLPKEHEFTPRFALRLVFDKSPYPPRMEWKRPEGSPVALKVWEWKEFCARESPELKALANPWWGKCVMY